MGKSKNPRHVWAEEQIQQIMEKWKTRLGLSDWDITVEFRDARDMRQNPARTYVNAALQHAEIRIMAMGDRQDCDPNYLDPETDIIHELMHIRLWATDPPEDCEKTLHICSEQAIEAITKALRTLDAE